MIQILIHWPGSLKCKKKMSFCLGHKVFRDCPKKGEQCLHNYGALLRTEAQGTSGRGGRWTVGARGL